SLGAVLYQLLTGEVPFRGNKRMLLWQVLHDDPRPPRKLNDRIPRDLETICLKALAKEPGRRYQTAGALALDVCRREMRGLEHGYVVRQLQQRARTLQGHTEGVTSLALSGDGKRLFSGSGAFGGKFNIPGEIKVWDLEVGKETLTLRGHTGPVTSLA